MGNSPLRNDKSGDEANTSGVLRDNWDVQRRPGIASSAADLRQQVAVPAAPIAAETAPSVVWRFNAEAKKFRADAPVFVHGSMAAAEARVSTVEPKRAIAASSKQNVGNLHQDGAASTAGITVVVDICDGGKAVGVSPAAESSEELERARDREFDRDSQDGEVDKGTEPEHVVER